eukprot:774105-Rhodomonas_salina.2
MLPDTVAVWSAYGMIIRRPSVASYSRPNTGAYRRRSRHGSRSVRCPYPISVASYSRPSIGTML